MYKIIPPYSKQRNDNEERYGSQSNSCFLCGKPTAINLMVHYTTDGFLVNEFDDTKVPESQGLFAIGSECAKKLPKSFILKIINHVD